MDVEGAAVQVLDALERHDKVLLSYFCEWLVKNRVIAEAGLPNPIESASAIETSVQHFVMGQLPEYDPRLRHDVYLEMTQAAWRLEYPQRFFKFEPSFSQRVLQRSGS